MEQVHPGLELSSKRFTEYPDSAATDKGKVAAAATTNPYAKPLPPECYRCQQLGHRSNECPQWRQLGYAGENEEVVKEFGECGDEFVDANVVHGNEGEAIVCILQKLLFAPRQAQLTLRNAIY